MELLVIRHGQSEADILGRHEGRADYALTDLGIIQAQNLADWISCNYPPNYIISSTLKRASMTAEILSKRIGVNVEYDDALMEFNNGLLAGLTHEEARMKYPIPEGGKKPHESYYEQETMIEFRARAETVLSRIIHEYPPDKRIAIISHGGMINMLFRSFLSLPMYAEYGIYNGDTAAHLWVIDGNKRYIKFSNSREHLISQAWRLTSVSLVGDGEIDDEHIFYSTLSESTGKIILEVVQSDEDVIDSSDKIRNALSKT